MPMLFSSRTWAETFRGAISLRASPAIAVCGVDRASTIRSPETRGSGRQDTDIGHSPRSGVRTGTRAKARPDPIAAATAVPTSDMGVLSRRGFDGVGILHPKGASGARRAKAGQRGDRSRRRRPRDDRMNPVPATRPTENATVPRRCGSLATTTCDMVVRIGVA
jgi:hypothetical protein